MAQDVLITPASGLIEFYETAGNLEASIQLDSSNNLMITGNVTLGDAGADIIIGDGVSPANVIFEQGGAIYGLATKTLTLGRANSNISFAGTITSALNINPGGSITGINLNNNNLIGVNHIIINDPGPGEGLQWAGGSGWQIYESPNDLTTNSGGNLQIVTGSTRRATFNTSGQLDLPVAIGTAPLVVVSTTRVANLNVATAGVADTATTAGTVTTAAQPNITSVGTLSALSVTGNITGGNLITAGLTSTGTLQTSGNAIVGGNLVVNGNTISVNIQNLNVQDPIIGLGRGANNAPLTTNDGKDRGTEMWYYNTAERAAFVGFDNSTGKLIAAANVSIADEIVTVNNYGTFVAGAVESTTVSASGNVTAGNVTGNFFIGNGSQLTGLPESGLSWTTQANATPSSPAPGDFWFDSYTGVKYQYINDGTSNIWVDQSYPTSFSTLAVTGNATIGGNLGVVGNVTADFFVGIATQAQYADLAEIYQPDQAYEPGTVLVFGGEHEVTVSTVSHDTRIAGVVSTAPAYLMNSQQSGIPVALTGRVPCRVRGPVAKGEQLVNIEPGIAGAIDFAQYRPGCVIGKSLENIEDSSVHTIEIAVGRY
jgi:hypothetical protein